MANVFAITTVSDKLKDENGSESTVFTVTNTTPRPIRAVAKVKPIGSTQISWLKIEGEKERDITAGATDQFTVNFNKPKPPEPPKESKPAETFQFRLDVISAANPDEDFSESQIISVDIPEEEVVVIKPFRGWWLVMAGAAVLLIVSGVVVWLVVRNPGVEVPNFIGKTFAEAEEQVKQINTDNATNVRIEKNAELAPSKEFNIIFDQEPKEGKLEDEQIISVKVPAIAVPDLAGKTLAEAEAQLKQINLERATNLTIVKEEVIAPDKEINKIFGQVPAAGDTADTAQVIKVNLPATINVPRVIEMTYDAAKTKLEGAGLKISGHFRTKEAPAPFPDKDLISFQSPLSGPVKKGTEVQVFSPCKSFLCLAIFDNTGIKFKDAVRKDLNKLKNQ